MAYQSTLERLQARLYVMHTQDGYAAGYIHSWGIETRKIADRYPYAAAIKGASINCGVRTMIDIVDHRPFYPEDSWTIVVADGQTFILLVSEKDFESLVGFLIDYEADPR